MKIYLKTCSLFEVKKAAEYGLIDGISLLSGKGDEKCMATDSDTKSIVTSVSGPVFIKASGDDAEEIINYARKLLPLTPNIVVSIKASLEAFKVCKLLSSRNVAVNICGLNSLTQAILAAKVGAQFISFDLQKYSIKDSREMKILTEAESLIRKHGLTSEVIATNVGKHPSLDTITGTGVQSIELSYKELLGIMI